MTKFYTKKEFLLSIIVTLIPTIYGIFKYNILPNQIAIHFNMNGNPDNFANKNLIIFAFPVLMILFQAFVFFLLKFKTKEQPVPKKMARLTIWIIPVISIVAYTSTIQYALNNSTDIRRIIVALVGLLFVILGNYMPTIPSNSGTGMHLGLKNIVVNAKDKYLQRYFGYILVSCGILILTTLILSPIASTIVTLTSIGVIILYSIFVFFKVQKKHS